METKRLIPLMLLSFALIFGWQVFVHSYLYPRHPEWRRPGEVATPTTLPSETSTTSPTTQVASTLPTTQSSPPQMTAMTPTTASAGVRVVSAATQPTVVTLGAERAYPIVVNVSSQGAGLESVELKDFTAPPDVAHEHPAKAANEPSKEKYVFQRPIKAGDPLTRPLATRTVTVNGQKLDLAAVHWNLERQDGKSASFVLDLGPVRARKVYELHDSSNADKGFELVVRHEFESTAEAGGAPAKVQYTLTGPVTPPREHERGPDLQIIAGYDDGYSRATMGHHLVMEYGEKHPSADITKGDENTSLMWVGTASVYFTALYRPDPLVQGKAAADYVGRVTAFSDDPYAPDYKRHGYVTIESTELTVQPGQPIVHPAHLFLGPRWRNILSEPHYANFPRDYDQSLVMRAGPCGYCTFDFLINGLVKLLGFFHMITRDWGLAIICLVILVRGLLHPITKKSQVSMMRMGKLGPEMERLKEKYGDDKDELNRQMMQLYKDQGVGMYLGCLPMFLQMPIWIALWSALNTTFELRQAPFLWGFTWIDDLARPDALIDFGRTFDLGFMGLYISSLNLLPILLAVVFYLQQEYTPKPPATTPEQVQQQKMMKWMSLLFPVFLYPTPSGLCLYIFTSTAIGIVESKRIRAHIKQKEEEEKAGKIIVDAPKSMKKRRDDETGGGGGGGAKKPQGPKGPQPKRTGIWGMLDEVKAKAEQLQREANRQRGGK